jgi:hypothetical protein
MEKKQGGRLLRKELDNLSFLQSYPEVQKHFSDAGCMTYVERLQEGYHQAIAEVFAKSYDGKKAAVGSLELIADEAAIASTTSLPRTGQIWFKTTVTHEEGDELKIPDQQFIMLSSQTEIKQSVFNIEISKGNEQLDYFQLIDLMNKQAGYRFATGFQMINCKG